MVKMRVKVFVAALLSAFLFIQKGYSLDDKELYYQGLKAVRGKETDFAFMYFRELLTDFPGSKFSEDALFAVGEYYFGVFDYYDCVETFHRFLTSYPESKARPFALMYLAKIARNQGKDNIAEDLDKGIIRFKHTRLLFKEFKEYKYTSGLLKKYKAVYFIDRIELYVNNELFAKIPL